MGPGFTGEEDWGSVRRGRRDKGVCQGVSMIEKRSVEFMHAIGLRENKKKSSEKKMSTERVP